MSNVLRTWLADDTAIAALVSDRLYLQPAPPSTSGAYIRVTTISAIPEECHESTLAAGEDSIRAQVDIYGPTAASVAEIKAAVRARVLQIGSIPIHGYAEPYDPKTTRWREVIDVIFSPVDVTG